MTKKFCEELIAYFPLMRHGPDKNDASNNASLPQESFYRATAQQR
jgi:hypothetical protein